MAYFVSTRTKDSRRVFIGRVAELAVEQLLADRDRYRFALLSFVLMPDHAHFIVVPAPGFGISQTMRLIKGNISRHINEHGGTIGSVWQDGFYDRVARSREDLNDMIKYVEENPVKAGLSDSVASYPYSSADGSCTQDYQRALFGRTETDDSPQGSERR
jgi:REP element-mobilizing transposase RayT